MPDREGSSAAGSLSFAKEACNVRLRNVAVSLLAEAGRGTVGCQDVELSPKEGGTSMVDAIEGGHRNDELRLVDVVKDVVDNVIH